MSDTFFFYSPRSYTLSDFHDRLAKAGLEPSRQQLREGWYQISAGPGAVFFYECPARVTEGVPEFGPLVLAAIGPSMGWLVGLRPGQRSFFAPFCFACVDDPRIVVPIGERIVYGPEFCKLVTLNPDDAFELANS